MGFDDVMGIFRIAATSVSKAAKAVLVNLDGGGQEGDPQRWQEVTIAQMLFGTIGLIVRPRAPSKDSKGQEQRAETLAAILGDALLAFAGRDSRLNGFYQNPKEGDVALVGYAGAFDSNSPRFDANGNPAGTERVTYIPYAFVNGVPTKAMTIEVLGVDGEESISIIHGDGMAITMKHGGKNSVVMKNKAGNVYTEVNDDGIIQNGNMVVNGGMTVGSPTAAQPAAIAAPLVTWAAAVVTALSGLGVTLPPLPPTVVATKTSIS